jgi:hypothetical protein
VEWDKEDDSVWCVGSSCEPEQSLLVALCSCCWTIALLTIALLLPGACLGYLEPVGLSLCVHVQLHPEGARAACVNHRSTMC